MQDRSQSLASYVLHLELSQEKMMLQGLLLLLMVQKEDNVTEIKEECAD